MDLKKTAAALLAAVFLLCSPAFGASVTVDASSVRGPVPYLFKTGIYTWYTPREQHRLSLERLSADHRLGVVKIPLDVDVFVPSKSPRDIERLLKPVDEFALYVKGKGARVAILIHGIPSWLSSVKSDRPAGGGLSGTVANFSPPRDYEEWGKFVEQLVDHFNNELKLDAMYVIWSEPDWDSWRGTEEEYFKLYSYAVLGARRADPKAQVGGPGVSSWKARKKNAKKPFLQSFLEYCGSAPQQGLQRLPLDFVEVHAFNTHPVLWRLITTDIRGWLKEAGYNPQTPLMIGEWNSWEGPSVTKDPFSSLDHDTEFSASYLVANLEAMNEASVQSHTFTTLYDVGGKEKTEFIGNFGIFTRHLVTKASYNALRMVSMMKGSLLDASDDDPFVHALASMEGGEVAVMVSNFLPTRKMHRNLVRAELSRKGYKLKNIEARQREIMEFIRSGGEKKGKLPDDLARDLREIMKKYDIDLQELERRARKPVDVEINLRNLKARGYVLTEYLVDPGHSNSYAVRARVDKALMEYRKEAGRDRELFNRKADAINEWPEVKLAKVSEKEGKSDGGLTYRATLKPYSVLMLVIRPRD